MGNTSGMETELSNNLFLVQQQPSVLDFVIHAHISLLIVFIIFYHFLFFRNFFFTIIKSMKQPQ